MSITDELRECIATAVWQYENDIKTAYIPKDRLTAIADRIDEQHAVKVERLEKYRAAVDAMLKEYVKLPVDADGVPIRIGDKLQSTRYEDGIVAGMECFEDTDWHIAVRPSNWDVATWRDPEEYRHHHEPTVEDVLREFADKVCSSDHLVKDGTFIGLEDTDLLAEYAKRLRLAGEAE